MTPTPAREVRTGRLRLTSEGLAWLATAALIGLLGWAKSLNLLLILAYIMLALLVLNGILARHHARNVRARRLVPPPVFAGEIASLGILLSNSGSKSASASIQDRTFNWKTGTLGPESATHLEQHEHFPKRGRVELTPLVVSCGFPFGFLGYDRTTSDVESIRVLPALGEADADGLRRWLLRRAGLEGRSRKVLRRLTHDFADVRGVRPYRPGDSIRAIHWRSSARRGELMVREYDAAPSPELILVVEPWLPVNPSEADRTKLEAALSLAATVARTWCLSIATRLTVLVPGDKVRSGPANDLFLREALTPLAETEGAESFPPVSGKSIGRLATRAARVVVSSRPNSSLAELLSQQVGKPFVALDPSQRLPWYRKPANAPVFSESASNVMPASPGGGE